MMMARCSVPLALFAALLIAGCGTTTAELPVRVEYSKTTSFHEWKSFRFASDATDTDHTRYPKYEKMARTALEEELTARGYERLEDGTPDFRVAFDLIFRGEKTPQIAPEGGGADPMAKSHAAPGPSGTLIVKMLDPLTSQILWTGHITNVKLNVIDPLKELKQAVWRLLAEFPPITG
jgi:hypothetical protein